MQPISDSRRPIAILLGIDTQIGLTIIRELGQHGVKVLGLAGDRHAPGIYSKYLWKANVRAESEPALIEQIRRLAEAHGPAVVMAVSENDIALLNRHRAALQGIPLLVPTAEKMAIVLDKTRTRELAQTIGIPVPQVWPVGSIDELERLHEKISFPVVLKWGDPLTVGPLLDAAGLPMDKFRYCYDWSDLSSYLAQFAPVGVFPIVQEYCPGYGLGQSVFMRNGEAHLLFQHRRLHEWPPEGGFSTLCESVSPTEHGELQRLSIRLLQLIGWEGAAMVEYRYDPVSRRAWLMEINGRFWGSLPLAYYSGAHFAWLTYSVLGLGAPGEPMRVKAGVRCRGLVTEAKRLIRIVFAPSRIQDKSLRFSKPKELADFLAGSINPTTKYFVFSWSDPKPAIYDLGFGLSRRVRSVLRKAD